MELSRGYANKVTVIKSMWGSMDLEMLGFPAVTVQLVADLTKLKGFGVLPNFIYFGLDPCFLLNILLNEFTVSNSVCSSLTSTEFKKPSKKAQGLPVPTEPFPGGTVTPRAHISPHWFRDFCRNCS